MTEERKLPFAAYPTDDGKAVSIITDREDTESYLLFTNKAVNQFTDVLTEALGFDEKDAFYLNWKDGEFIYGWNWTDGTALHLEAGLTFGEMIEEIVSMYSQSKEYEDTTWKNDPDNFGMKKLQGYEIYQNLSRCCIPLLEKKGGMKLPDGVDDKTLYKTLESIVSVELVEQIGNRVSIDGKTILPKLRSEGICGDPLALAGLCLLWHDLFFDFSHTGRMKKEDLQDRNLLKRCKKMKCEYQGTDTLLWESESRNGADFSPFSEMPRAWIAEERCYCGKTRIVAKRFTTTNEREPEIVDSTDHTMVNKDKEIIIGPENPFDYGRYCGESAPEILKKEQTGFPEDMEFQRGTMEFPMFQINGYKKDILTSLLCSIFDAKRNYDVDEQIDELDDDGNVKLDKDGNAKKVRNPAYGRREGDKELPLPENDIQLLVSKIVLKYEFFASTATDPYSDRQEGWNGDGDLLQAMRQGQFGYLLLEATYNRLGYDGNIDIERLESEVKKNSAKDRAAKHRLGRKMGEIGRFLQWWDDLAPILEHVYGEDWKFTTKRNEDGEGKKDGPLRILKDGIRNVRGVNGG